jgi:hypothetical protein
MTWMIEEYIWTTAGGVWARHVYPDWDWPTCGYPPSGWVTI